MTQSNPSLHAALGGKKCLLFVTLHHVRDENERRFSRLHHHTRAQLRDGAPLIFAGGQLGRFNNGL